MKTRFVHSAKILVLTGALAASFIAQLRPATAQTRPPMAKVEAGLRFQVESSGRDTYIVLLSEKADLSPAYAIEDWSERGRFVHDALVETARTSQADLIAYLRSERDAGNVVDFHSFFIANAVEVTSTVDTMDAVAARYDVSQIMWPRTARLHQAAAAPFAVEWGIDRIDAPGVWADFGTLGEGVVVANIDTGAQHDHPALVAQYRGTQLGSHDFSFYDPANVCGGDVCDNNGHGSHTIGTMVGSDNAGNQIGVAPGATWIAAKGCESSSCSGRSLLNAGQWMLAPCAFGKAPGDPSCDPDMRPHVINNSWGGGRSSWYQSTVDAWRAAGIIPVFSAGNAGPGSRTVGAPGGYCNVIGVGATSISDTVAGFSSRGPGSFAGCSDKPDISAPGVSIRSSVPFSTFGRSSGTSMAAPHVAGCAALLLSLDPTLTFENLYDLLTTSAVDLGSPGFDFDYGQGRLDCRAAAARLDLPKPPIAHDDDVSTPEDTPVAIDVVSNDSDPDGDIDVSTIRALTRTSFGTLTNRLDGVFDYAPQLNFHGADSFTYEICDTSGACDTASVSITVTSVNDPPVPAPDVARTLRAVPVTIRVSANDRDVDGNLDPRSITVDSAPSNGAAVANDDGTITYTPNASFLGMDRFTYEICDTVNACGTAGVDVSVVLQTSLTAAADSVLLNKRKTQNEGANPLLNLGSRRRVILGFDLAGVDLSKLSSAKLVLTIHGSARAWGKRGQNVDVYRVVDAWVEGDGKSLGIRRKDQERGTGAGVTWHCASDIDIASSRKNCSTRWRGGAIQPTASDSALHTSGMSGTVEWDVTADVAGGAASWLLKKKKAKGGVLYYSKDHPDVGTDPDLAPRLVLTFDP